MKKFRTPQEKKVLSYKKDCRNCYGEDTKATRKGIPSSKRWVNQTYRSRIKHYLQINNVNDEFEIDCIEDKVKSIKRKYWKKLPDRPLGLYLHYKNRNNESKIIGFVEKSVFFWKEYRTIYTSKAG